MIEEPVIPTVEEIKHRYLTEDIYKDMVHEYLGYGWFTKFRLAYAKRIRKKWYANRVNQFITDYAIRIKDDITKAHEVEEEIAKLHDMEKNVGKTLTEIAEEREKIDKKKTVFEIAEEKRLSARSVVQNNYKTIEKQRLEDLAQQKREIKARTDAEKMVREQIQEHIKQSELVIVDEYGQLKPDEERLVKKLGNIFLDKIIEGIEKTSGKGFYSNLKQDYEGVIAYWAEMDDPSELDNVDWIESAIYSRTMGCRKVRYPYLITGKRESRARGQIDSALAIDYSGSMDQKNRWIIGKKASLALNTLMERLNPDNQNYLAYFHSEHNREVSPAEFYKLNSPNGGTPTELAIEWFIEKLADRGPSIATLVSDGAPNETKFAIRAAEKLKYYPNINLRIFLIDGDEETRNITKDIGYAAGPDTRVIPVEIVDLSGKLIEDVSLAVRGMYEIDRL